MLWDVFDAAQRVQQQQRGDVLQRQAADPGDQRSFSMRSIQRAALRGLQPLYLVACSSRAIASTVTPATAWRVSLSN